MKRLLFLHYLQDINRNKRVERVARDKAAEGSKPDSVASSSVRLRLLPLIYNPLSRRNQELLFLSACQRVVHRFSSDEPEIRVFEGVGSAAAAPRHYNDTLKTTTTTTTDEE
ncbi:hypothetical protein F2P81_002759 [Scophthalmus maximus]|uniref:Uncharacterized protein n=1 Tax=Scophthalmus maximus TaxID=52904 RepID=A0A6A4TRJ8_SCOMX|nr:hypothetical protein F2P81_002759 [Scophthalmus maximus]